MEASTSSIATSVSTGTARGAAGRRRFPARWLCPRSEPPVHWLARACYVHR